MNLNRLLVVILTAACADKLDTTRKPVDTGTFGATVYDLTCTRLAYQLDLADGGKVDVSGNKYRQVCRTGAGMPADAYPAVRALDGHRVTLTTAVDTTFPDDQLTAIQGFVTTNQFLGLYDDGTAEAVADETATLFDSMAADTDFTGAMARLDTRPGYRAAPANNGALKAMASYPSLEDFLLNVMDAIGPSGVAEDAWNNLQHALAKELQDAAPAADDADPERSLTLALNLLLGESAYLGEGESRWAVRRDWRGLALVDPSMPPPFADVDGDGLADVDSNGNFVDGSGNPIQAPPPFPTQYAADTAPSRDSAGRAMQSDGVTPIY
jgi:hypothetical protein